MDQLQRRVEVLQAHMDERNRVLQQYVEEDSDAAKLQNITYFIDNEEESQEDVCQSLSEESSVLEELAGVCTQMANDLEDNDRRDPPGEEIAELMIRTTDLKNELQAEMTPSREEVVELFVQRLRGSMRKQHDYDLEEDSETARLQKKTTDFLEKNGESQEDVCQSLSEESSARREVEFLADRCQQMANDVEDKDRE